MLWTNKREKKRILTLQQDRRTGIRLGCCRGKLTRVALKSSSLRLTKSRLSLKLCSKECPQPYYYWVSCNDRAFCANHSSWRNLGNICIFCVITAKLEWIHILKIVLFARGQRKLSFVRRQEINIVNFSNWVPTLNICIEGEWSPVEGKEWKIDVLNISLGEYITHK